MYVCMRAFVAYAHESVADRLLLLLVVVGFTPISAPAADPLCLSIDLIGQMSIDAAFCKASIASI